MRAESRPSFHHSDRFFCVRLQGFFFFSSARDTDAGRARDANSVNEVPLKPWFLLFVFDSRALYT